MTNKKITQKLTMKLVKAGLPLSLASKLARHRTYEAAIHVIDIPFSLRDNTHLEYEPIFVDGYYEYDHYGGLIGISTGEKIVYFPVDKEGTFCSIPLKRGFSL